MPHSSLLTATSVADMFLRSGELAEGLAGALEEFRYIVSPKTEDAGVHVYDFTGPVKVPSGSSQKIDGPGSLPTGRVGMFGSCSVTSLSLGSHFKGSCRPLFFGSPSKGDVVHMVLFSWFFLQVSLAVLA